MLGLTQIDTARLPFRPEERHKVRGCSLSIFSECAAPHRQGDPPRSRRNDKI